jgi:hypothetical protein
MGVRARCFVRRVISQGEPSTFYPSSHRARCDGPIWRFPAPGYSAYPLSGETRKNYDPMEYFAVWPSATPASVSCCGSEANFSSFENANLSAVL